jgi:diguanylate cyclase (GGDEF)-like protein
MRLTPSNVITIRNAKPSLNNHDAERIKRGNIYHRKHLYREQASYKFYSLISRLSFPKSYSGKVILLIHFGISLPMLFMVVYLLTLFSPTFIFKLQTLSPILIVLILGSVVTLYAVRSLVSPLTLVSHTLNQYVHEKRVPNLPTHFTDEVGRLMKDVQFTVSHIDDLIQSLEKASMTDYLTGTYNRHSGEKRLKEDISRVKRGGGTISLAILDIDDFKSVNDEYGHHTGDICLMHLVTIIKSSIREGDLLVRWGGDEFVLILFNSDLQSSGKILERICVAIREQAVESPQGRIHLTLSAGMCQYNGSDGVEVFFKKADSALLLAKRLGKSQVVHYPFELFDVTRDSSSYRAFKLSRHNETPPLKP